MEPALTGFVKAAGKMGKGFLRRMSGYHSVKVTNCDLRVAYV